MAFSTVTLTRLCTAQCFRLQCLPSPRGRGDVRKRLIALTPYSLIAFATINLFTYSPMFLITETNCNEEAAVAAAVVPFRARRKEVPVVCVAAICLFT